MNFEDFILDSLEGIGEFDFSMMIRLVIVSSIFFWFFVLFWVWTDSRERSTKVIFSILSVLLVAPFNILGLIVYLLIRPKDTIESLFWADLERRYLIHETADLGDCSQCGYQLSPDFNACPQCSTPCKIECPECKAFVRTDWKYCPVCSHQLLSRRMPEKEITQEVMERNLEETREQAVSAVENNRIRYKTRGSLLAKIGRPVLSGVISFGSMVDSSVRKILSVFSGKKRKIVRGQGENNAVNYATTGVIQLGGEFNSSNNKKFKKKKKKKKRR